MLGEGRARWSLRESMLGEGRAQWILRRALFTAERTLLIDEFKLTVFTLPFKSYLILSPLPLSLASGK